MLSRVCCCCWFCWFCCVCEEEEDGDAGDGDAGGGELVVGVIVCVWVGVFVGDLKRGSDKGMCGTRGCGYVCKEGLALDLAGRLSN